ncbi:hypothetical protein JXM83_06225 [Candidatus Woesearchaeota archaeon]|nr:hypothetical protein [Candidatus Woesearchaeota archaeon]
MEVGKGLGHFTESVSILDSFKKFNDERLLHEFERFCSLLSEEEGKFLFEVLVERIKKSGDVKDLIAQFNSLVSKNELIIPISIFASGFSPYESIVKYLKENLNLRHKEISQYLGKSESSVWTTYRNSQKRNLSLKLDFSCVMPLSSYVLKNSVLENVVMFLVDTQGMKIKDVSVLLDKSLSTIWTTYNKVRSR